MAIEEKRVVGETKARTLAYLSQKIFGDSGIQILRFVKSLLNPPIYRLETDRGVIRLGKSFDLLSRARCQATIYDATDHIIPSFDSSYWRDLVALLTEVRDEETDAVREQEARQIREQLGRFLADSPAVDNLAAALTMNVPCRLNGNLAFSGPAFTHYLEITGADTYTGRHFGKLMRFTGWKPRRIDVYIGKKRTSRYLWTMPRSMAKEYEIGAYKYSRQGISEG